LRLVLMGLPAVPLQQKQVNFIRRHHRLPHLSYHPHHPLAKPHLRHRISRPFQHKHRHRRGPGYAGHADT
ncbi:MAG: hypothetical protein WAK10_06490, partial [Methanoregula sp.]